MQKYWACFQEKVLNYHALGKNVSCGMSFTVYRECHILLES